MPTDDRWSPVPPRGEGRARPVGSPPPGQTRHNGHDHAQGRRPPVPPPQRQPGYPSPPPPAPGPPVPLGQPPRQGRPTPPPFDPLAPLPPPRAATPTTYGAPAQYGSAPPPTYGAPPPAGPPQTYGAPYGEQPAYGGPPSYGGPQTYAEPVFEPDPAPAFEKNPRRIRSHGARKRRVPIWMVVILILGVAVVGAGLRFLPGSPLSSTAGDGAGPDATAGPTPTPTPPPLPFHAADVTLESVGTQGFLSWALLDRRSGEIVGSANMTATSDTASMIKGWLASDYLRRAEEAGQTPSASRLADLETMIRDSDNDAADRTYNANGKTASIDRLISMCKLTDSKAVPGLWSNTTVSARDVVRMGACIADGKAAGDKWTPWVLDMMKKVRGTGDFGIRKALPAAQASQVSIKNGWLLRDEDSNWHTNCMAIGDTWVLSVMQRYPSQGNYEADFQHTADVCQKVATQLLNPAAS